MEPPATRGPVCLSLSPSHTHLVKNNCFPLCKKTKKTLCSLSAVQHSEALQSLSKHGGNSQKWIRGWLWLVHVWIIIWILNLFQHMFFCLDVCVWVCCMHWSSSVLGEMERHMEGPASLRACHRTWRCPALPMSGSPSLRWVCCCRIMLGDITGSVEQPGPSHSVCSHCQPCWRCRHLTIS